MGGEIKEVNEVKSKIPKIVLVLEDAIDEEEKVEGEEKQPAISSGNDQNYDSEMKTPEKKKNNDSNIEGEGERRVSGYDESWRARSSVRASSACANPNRNTTVAASDH